MPADHVATADPIPNRDTPRLTRRSALFGAAAALVAPLAPRLALADTAPAAPAATALVPEYLRLDGNENPYGPSPAARKAILDSVAEAPRYAETSVRTLTEQVAAREGVPPACVMIGTGSGELLRVAALQAATTRPGSEVVACKPTYEELPEFAARLGLAVQWVAPDAAHRHDLAAMRAAIGERTSLVYVCNPNNPTGTVVGREALEKFVRSVPATVTVLVDEAYIDFVDAADAGTVAGLTQQVPNLVVLRTFSKLHGLAGLRIGYSIASPELAQRLADLALVWPNSTGLDAAIASYNDLAFQKSTRAAILADRARLHATLDRLGLQHAAAQGNFVFFDTGMPVQQFRERMKAQGIKVGRPFAGYPTWSRTTIGRHDEVDRFLAALPLALKG
jgi:histidinol-phosphate aminotransferase